MKISILTYHAISKEKEENRYTIEEKDFHNHLKFLYDNKYECILVDDYYQSLSNPLIELPRKRVIITFDDGHESVFKIAFPLLEKYNFKATFFITTDWIGKPGYMSSGHLRKLRRAGMSVQSHAKTHFFLDQMGIDEIYHELDQSKKTLEDILEEKVSFISFPGGRYNKNVIECSKKMSYSAVFCSIPFYLKKFDDVYLIGRNMIKNSCRIEKIICMNKLGEIRDRMSYIGKSFLKRVLGNNIYYFFWKKYFC